MTDDELNELLEKLGRQADALEDLTRTMKRQSGGATTTGGHSPYNAGIDNFAKSLESSITKAIAGAGRTVGRGRAAGSQAGKTAAAAAAKKGKSPEDQSAARQAASSRATADYVRSTKIAAEDLSRSFLSLGKAFTSGTAGAESFATAAQSGGKFLLATFGKSGPWAIAAQAALSAMVVAAKQADKQHAVFEQLQEAGANSAGGLNDVNKMLGNFGLSVNEAGQMLSLLTSNTNGLLMFRGSLAEASAEMGKTFALMGESGLRKELKLLGISYEEQRQGLAKNTELQGRLGRAQSMSVQQLAASTANYLKEQTELTKLTGATRKEQEAQREKAMAQEQFRFKIESLKRSGRGDEAAALEKTNQQVAATLGDDIAAQFRSMSDGIITEQNKGLEILTGGKASQLAMRKDLTPKQMTDELVKAIRATQGGGVDQQAQYGGFEKLTGIRYGDMLDKMEKTTDLEARRAKVEKELTDLAKGNGSVKNMVEIDEANLAMKKAYQDFVQLAVGPATKALSMLAKVGGAFAKVLGFVTDVIGPPLELLGDILGGIVDVFSGILDGIKSVFSTIGDIIASPFKFVGSMLGFAEGGYTGHGGKYEPAGIVHKGEYVLNAETTKALGLNKLPGLSQDGYATGGKVGGAPGAGMDFGDISKNLLSFNDGLNKIVKNKVLFGTGPESLVGPDGILSQLGDTVKTLSDSISAASSGLFDKISKFFSDVFGDGSGGEGGGTKANATQMPSTGGNVGGTSGNYSTTGTRVDTKGMTESLYRQTEDAINQGIKYGYGSKDIKSGRIDCSGWVSNMTTGMMDAVNKEAGKDVYGKEAKQAMKGSAADITQNVAKQTGFMLQGDDVKAENLKEGMTLGMATGGGKGNGRFNEIDHIAQVIKDVETGKMMVSESTGDASKGGVKKTDLNEYLANYKKQGTKFYATDPTLMAEGAGAGFATTQGGAVTGNPQAANRGAAMGATQGGPLGSVAEKYETGGRGSGTIGWDKTGGTSYGKYQIASKTGSMDEYIKHLAQTNPDAAAQLQAAGPADTGKEGKFAQTWKQLSDTGALGDTENTFIKKKSYDPALAGIKDKGLQDMISGNKGLQEMLFSTSTQHGAAGASGIMNKIYKPGMSQEDLVNATYAERGTRFGSSTPEVQAGVQKRFGKERGDIMAMMGQPSLPGAPSNATMPVTAGMQYAGITSLFGGGASGVAGPTLPMAAATPGQTDLNGMVQGAQASNQGVMQGGIGTSIDSLISTLTSSNTGTQAGGTGSDTSQTQLLETIVSLQREQNSTLVKILQSSTA